MTHDSVQENDASGNPGQEERSEPKQFERGRSLYLNKTQRT
jgi:hypothetical protein